MKRMIETIEQSIIIKVWNYCDKKQREILKFETRDGIYEQAQLIVYREVQWELLGKCSDIIAG